MSTKQTLFFYFLFFVNNVRVSEGDINLVCQTKYTVYYVYYFSYVCTRKFYVRSRLFEFFR